MSHSPTQLNHPIAVHCHAESLIPHAERLAKVLNTNINSTAGDANYAVVFTENGVALQSLANPKVGAVQVDFAGGKNDHRRKFGGGKSQMIAKACGVKGTFKPSILDATAGLAQDGFALACLGCTVTLVERSPIAHTLVQDGLTRAHTTAEANDDEDLRAILSRITLHLSDSITYLKSASLMATDTPMADVIYLDPMFPAKQKSAAVNKNMQAFHTIIGFDLDDAELLAAARPVARYRVVVKRPRRAPAIEGPPPTYKLEGKSSRYDIYVNKGLPEKG